MKSALELPFSRHSSKARFAPMRRAARLLAIPLQLFHVSAHGMGCHSGWRRLSGRDSPAWKGPADPIGIMPGEPAHHILIIEIASATAYSMRYAATTVAASVFLGDEKTVTPCEACRLCVQSARRGIPWATAGIKPTRDLAAPGCPVPYMQVQTVGTSFPAPRMGVQPLRPP